MAHQMAGIDGGIGDMDGDMVGGMDGGIDDIALPVRFEPCGQFRDDHTSVWPVCGACGWLADDHVAVAADAVVTALPRRGVQLPARKAS